MRARWVALATLFGGCNVPSLPSGVLSCAPDGGCADNLVCSGGLCYALGAVPGGSASSGGPAPASSSGGGSTASGSPGTSTSGASTGTGTTASGSSGTSGGSTAGSDCPAPARDVYVSPDGGDASGDGSAQRAWATLTWADQHAPPGATIHVAPGTYGFTETTAAGTAQARRRFVSDVPWGAKVLSQVPSNAAWQSTGDYVDIEGFDISGPGPIGLYLGGSHARAIHNFIHDLPSAGCPLERGGGILIEGGAVGSEALGNVVFDVGDPTRGCPVWPGIAACGTAGLVANNLVFLNTGFGISACDTAAGVAIANNTVFNNASGGIQIASLPASGGGMQVVNNLVYENGALSDGGGIVDPSHAGVDQFVDNLVAGNAPADLVIAAGNSVRGGLSGNPQFVRYTGDLSGDYHLAPGSPALGVGSASGAPAEDLDEAPRPGTDGYDLGAYQSGSGPAAWPFCPAE